MTKETIEVEREVTLEEVLAYERQNFSRAARGEAEDPAKTEPKLTVADLKAALDAKGITYEPTAKKAELQALLDGSQQQ